MTDHTTPDAGAVKAIAELTKAGEAVTPIDEFGRQFLIVPPDKNVRDVTLNPPLRDHIEAAPRFHDRDSLVAYANAHGVAPVIFADIDASAFTVVLDYHEGQDVKRCTHCATLALRESEEFARWNAFAGTPQSQRDFARFLEENGEDIISPDSADMLELALDLDVKQDGHFKSQMRLENGDREFTFTTKDNVQSKIAVPTEITIEIPIYLGEPALTLTLKFRYRVDGGQLLMAVEWHRMELQRQEEFARIAGSMGGGISNAALYFGTR